MVGFCHGGNLLGNHDNEGRFHDDRQTGHEDDKQNDDDDDDDYPANSHHDKNPPWWEFVSNEYGGNMPVTKSHH